MPDYQSILSAASELPVADRLRLIDELAASVPDDQTPSLAEAWLEEIHRRSAEIESGAVPTESWDVVRSRLFKKHGVDGADRLSP
jgi:putative addiction module component (TIGR02574 family)